MADYRPEDMAVESGQAIAREFGGGAVGTVTSGIGSIFNPVDLFKAQYMGPIAAMTTYATMRKSGELPFAFMFTFGMNPLRPIVGNKSKVAGISDYIFGTRGIGGPDKIVEKLIKSKLGKGLDKTLVRESVLKVHKELMWDNRLSANKVGNALSKHLNFNYAGYKKRVNVGTTTTRPWTGRYKTKAGERRFFVDKDADSLLNRLYQYAVKDTDKFSEIWPIMSNLSDYGESRGGIGFAEVEMKNRLRNRIMKERKTVIKKITALKQMSSADIYKKVFTKDLLNNFSKMSIIGRVGAIANPIIWGLTAADVVAWGAGMAYKGALAASQFAESLRVNSRRLEMGGSLTRGYTSQGAATERQRLMAELQRTPLAGRRFMGQEASLYAGMV